MICIVAEAGEGHGWAGATNNLAEDTYYVLYIIHTAIGKSTPVHVLLAYLGMCKSRDDDLSGKKTIA